MQIDFHTHLLPNMDDGSQSVEESLALLSALHTQGVDITVATPHFYSNKTGLDDFLRRRDAAYAQLQSAQSEQTPKLLLGAEVSFFRGMGKADRLSELCISGTNALLIEMPFSQWKQGELAEMHQILNRGMVPMIAHLERYFAYQKDWTAFNEIINLPIHLQMNAEAVLRRRTRKFVFKLMEREFPVLLGTDCHNMKKRKPEMAAARKILADHFGENCLEKLDALGAQLLNN